MQCFMSFSVVSLLCLVLKANVEAWHAKPKIFVETPQIHVCGKRKRNDGLKAPGIRALCDVSQELQILFSFCLQFCRQVWLGLYDTRSRMEPDSKDENKIRDFMTQKYEKKR